jgi:hypothetical protein
VGDRFQECPRSRRACTRAGANHKTGVGVVPPTPVCGLAIEWSRFCSSVNATPRAEAGRAATLARECGSARPGAAPSGEEQRAGAGGGDRPTDGRPPGDKCAAKRRQVPARRCGARLAVETGEAVDPHASLDRIVVCRATSAHHRVGLSCASSARMRRRTSGSAAVVTPDALSEVCDPKPAFRGTAVRRSGVRISDGESVDRPSGPETGVRRAVRRAGEAWSGHLAPPSAPRSGRLRTGTWRRSLCCIRQELPRCP